MMASRWRTWDIDFCDSLKLRPSDHEVVESVAVRHSFGRGSRKWRELAEQIVLPKAALASLRRRQSEEEPVQLARGGGAGHRMGGVCAPELLRPKASGRARALRMRQRCPGHSLRKPLVRQDFPSTDLSQPTASHNTVPSSQISSNHESGDPCVGRPTSDGTRGQKQQDWMLSTVSAEADSASEYSLELSGSSQEEGEIPLSRCLPTNHWPDWPIDENTVCFQNLPLSVTANELEQVVKAFGNVTHCSVMVPPNEAGLATAYVRMEKRSACDWVISCFHGNPYDDSPLQLTCFFALEPK